MRVCEGMLGCVRVCCVRVCEGVLGYVRVCEGM